VKPTERNDFTSESSGSCYDHVVAPDITSNSSNNSSFNLDLISAPVNVIINIPDPAPAIVSGHEHVLVSDSHNISVP